MAGAARIAEFFASVGFQADERSLKSALTKVAAFGASVSVLAGGVFASLVGIAKAEADIAAQADKLGTSSERLEELRYVAEQTGSSADKLTAALESIASNKPPNKTRPPPSIWFPTVCGACPSYKENSTRNGLASIRRSFP